MKHLHHLTKAIQFNRAYTYDKRGNRTGETVTGSENHTYVSTYDANNRLLSKLEYTDSDSYTGVNYFYDGNGNQVRKNHVTGTGSSEATSSREIFAYTVSNRLKSYTNTKTATSATYTYKATGMRDTKTVGGVTTGFVWSGNNMVAQTNSSGAVQNQYHYGVDGILSATLGTTNVQD